MRLHLMETRNLTRRCWPGQAAPLSGIDLTVCAGELVAILGQHGSGKTLLLRTLGLLEPPTGGQIFFENRLVTGLPAAELAELRRTAIGFDPERRPKLLLVDEPALSTGQMLRLLDLNAQGQTVVYGTSSPLLAAKATVVYRLSRGRLHRLDLGILPTEF